MDPPSPAPGIDVPARLRLALTSALRARDAIAVSALPLGAERDRQR